MVEKINEFGQITDPSDAYDLAVMEDKAFEAKIDADNVMEAIEDLEEPSDEAFEVAHSALEKARYLRKLADTAIADYMKNNR